MRETVKSFLENVTGELRAHAEVYFDENDSPLYYSLGWASEMFPLQVISILSRALEAQKEYENQASEESKAGVGYEGIIIRTDRDLPDGSRRIEHVGLPKPVDSDVMFGLLQRSELAKPLEIRVNTANGDIGIQPNLYISVLSHIPVQEWVAFAQNTVNQGTVSSADLSNLIQVIDETMDDKT